MCGTECLVVCLSFNVLSLGYDNLMSIISYSYILSKIYINIFIYTRQRKKGFLVFYGTWFYMKLYSLSFIKRVTMLIIDLIYCYNNKAHVVLFVLYGGLEIWMKWNI